MTEPRVNMCITSDHAALARHLNQEAAKTIKFRGMPEDDAFKMAALNPAKALHVADRVGSIKEGKDADLVLWNDNPLSVYAKPEKTIVDGIIYFDLDHDALLRQNVAAERNRLVLTLFAEKSTRTPIA